MGAGSSAGMNARLALGRSRVQIPPGPLNFLSESLNRNIPLSLLMYMRAKYAYLLEDVRRWFDNFAAKSLLTATFYLRNLGLYCDLNKTDPKSILKVARTKAFRDGFTDFVRRLEQEGKASSYIARFKKTLNSWGLRVLDAEDRPTPFFTAQETYIHF